MAVYTLGRSRAHGLPEVCPETIILVSRLLPVHAVALFQVMEGRQKIRELWARRLFSGRRGLPIGRFRGNGLFPSQPRASRSPHLSDTAQGN